LRDVVSISASQREMQRHAMRVYDDVMFAARLSSVRRIWPGFFPAPIARTDDESITTLGAGVKHWLDLSP